ncbi:MAG TPA: DUF2254 domain-containing protein [Bacillus bacterium]|nr:DUF2254 domain-containing protein [Bacillus sp. (in: firmicutes)]
MESLATKYILKIRQSIWFIPGVYSTLAGLIALLVIYIDQSGFLRDFVPSLLLTEVELAQDILGAIATALLTMTTITFSTIMIVLTTYSSQFSPRTLGTFVEDPITLRVLGIFIGGFVYSILTLLFMSETFYGDRVISATIGVAIAIVCLTFFVYFIHNVATSIQVSTLIRKLSDEAREAVHNKKEFFEKGNVKRIQRQESSLRLYKYQKEITANKYGYVQVIDFEGLERIAVKSDILIEIPFPIGEFVCEGMVAFRIHYNQEDQELDMKLGRSFKIGKERTGLQDPEFALQKLVEVALRAISPGINDPNTAKNCIFHLGMVLSELCRLEGEGEYVGYLDENANLRVIGREKNIRELLYTSFYQITQYGEKDISILLALMDAFILVGKSANHLIKSILWEIYCYTIEKFDHEQIKELDNVYLNRKKQELEEVLGKSL